MELALGPGVGYEILEPLASSDVPHCITMNLLFSCAGLLSYRVSHINLFLSQPLMCTVHTYDYILYTLCNYVHVIICVLYVYLSTDVYSI